MQETASRNTQLHVSKYSKCFLHYGLLSICLSVLAGVFVLTNTCKDPCSQACHLPQRSRLSLHTLLLHDMPHLHLSQRLPTIGNRQIHLNSSTIVPRSFFKPLNLKLLFFSTNMIMVLILGFYQLVSGGPPTVLIYNLKKKRIYQKEPFDWPITNIFGTCRHSKIEACFVMLPFGSLLFTSYIIYTWKLNHGQTI